MRGSRRTEVAGRHARRALLVVLLAVPLTGVATTLTTRVAGAAVTQYGDSSISNPTSVITGADGALWFTNSGNDSVGRVTTTGMITNYADPSVAKPTAIAAGSDGALWFTNSGNSSIGRITTDGVITNFRDPLIVTPIDITAGPDGALWFTNLNNSIGRITTAGVVKSYVDPTISNPTSIATGPGGVLWFTNYSNNTIGRITTAGSITNYTDPSGGPSNITAGPDGAMWFTNRGNHSIGRVSAGGLVTYHLAAGIDSPFSIAAGPDGAMWFTNNGHHSIGRITVRGIVTHYTDPVIANPLGITTGPDGALWFDNVGNDAIGRIAVETLPASVPDSPSGAWVVSTGPDSVAVGFAPGFNGGVTDVSYTATCVSLDSEPSGTATGNVSPIVVTGLTSMHPYQCTVVAMNLVGSSVASAASNVVWPGATGPGCGMPSAPKMVSTAPGNASAVVSWAPAASGCVAGYIVTPYLTSGAQLSTLVPGQGTTTVISHLVNGTSYRFTVTAENGTVEGPTSAISAAVTVGSPSAATALSAVRVAKGALKITFKVPRANGATITRYTATCRSNNGGATRAKAGKAPPLTMSGLTAAKAYTCVVVAKNSRGDGAPSGRSPSVKA